MSSQDPRNAKLTAKQLVFFFIAATVVAVVVFLCGVLVGRSVSTADNISVETPGPSSAADPDNEDLSEAIFDSVNLQPSAESDSNNDLTLTYYRRLGGDDQVLDIIQTENNASTTDSTRSWQTVDTGSEAVSSVRTARLVESDAEKVSMAAPHAGLPGSISSDVMVNGKGYTVQVTALRRVDVANQVATRLLLKGFPAYVLKPLSDSPVSVYRVRVGRYVDRDEAEKILQRLEREEHFNPWITR